jgi:hypothetical protein
MRRLTAMFPFGHVPVVIFDLIHSYLSHSQYRRLMNCNISTFRSIKYETVYYQVDWEITIAHHTSTDDRTAFLEMIQRNVKDKHRQVGLRTSGFRDMAHLNLYSPVFTGIHSLTIILPNNTHHPLLLSMFSNIYILELTNLRHFKSLGDFFGDIHTLILRRSPDLIAVGSLKALPSLKKVELHNCESLVDVSSLKGLSEVKIFGCYLVQNSSLLTIGHHEIFNYSGICIVTSLFQFRNTYRLSVKADLGDCDLKSSFQYCTTAHLNLHNTNINTVCDLPFLSTIQTLSLTRFDISSWNQSLELLSSATLERVTIPDVSIFRTTKKLALKYCNTGDNLSFSSFTALKQLDIVGLSKLETLSISCVTCQRLSISDCEMLETIQSIGSLRSILIDGCYELTELSGLIKCEYMNILSCLNFCNGNNLIGVTSLEIENCSSFSDLSMLGHLNTLVIKDCSNVSQLRGLENVCTLKIFFCNIESLDGLGNNTVVHISGAGERLFKEYQEGKYDYLKEKIGCNFKLSRSFYR